MKKIKLSIVTSLVVVSVLNSSEIKLDEVVVSATKSEQSVKDVTSNIEVITKEELQEQHITTINEVINRVKGITVSQSGGLGQQTSFFLRGLDTESSLILINGVKFNDPTTIGGQAELAHLPVSDIERIEIIKGAQSGIYGSNASAGVINIITKKAIKKFQINTKVEVGSFDTKKVQFSVSKRFDKLSFYAGYSELDTDGFTAKADKDSDIDKYEDDGYNNKIFNSAISYNFTTNDRIDIKYTNIDAKADYDNSLANQDDYTLTQDNEVLNTSFIHNYSTNSYSKIFYTKAKFLKKDPKGWTKRFEGNNEETGIDTKISYQNNNSFVLFGMDKKESKDIVNNRKLDVNGLYITNSNKIDKTILTATLRKDNYSEFKDKTTGKIGVKHSINNNLSLSSNYGTSYRVPSLYEYNQNKNLKPESVKSFDFQIAYKNLSFTYFKNDIEDEILYSSTTWSYYNSNKKSHIKGYELSYQAPIFDETLLNLNYTIFDAKDEDGYQLAKRPKSIANISIDYYGIEKTHINLNAQYIGDRVEYNWGTHDIKAKTGNYTVANLIANYQLKKNLSTYLKVKNLTDKKYQTVDGYATSPRAFYVGFDASF